MTPCSEHEETLSAFIDGEVGSARAAASLAHALECASCGDFYRGARQLQRRLLESEESEIPERVWNQVREAAGWRRSWSLPNWALRAAAVLAVAVGAWLVARGDGVRRPAELAAPSAALVASAPQSDEEYARLASQVLAAGPRFQRELLTVLESLNARREGGRLDDRLPRAEEAREEESAVATDGRAPFVTPLRY